MANMLTASRCRAVGRARGPLGVAGASVSGRRHHSLSQPKERSALSDSNVMLFISWLRINSADRIAGFPLKGGKPIRRHPTG